MTVAEALLVPVLDNNLLVCKYAIKSKKKQNQKKQHLLKLEYLMTLNDSTVKTVQWFEKVFINLKFDHTLEEIR